MLITQISQRAPSTLKFPILFACSSSHPILSRLQVVAAVAVVVVIVFPSRPRKFSASRRSKKILPRSHFTAWNLELGCSFNSSQFPQFLYYSFELSSMHDARTRMFLFRACHFSWCPQTSCRPWSSLFHFQYRVRRFCWPYLLSDSFFLCCFHYLYDLIKLLFLFSSRETCYEFML